MQLAHPLVATAIQQHSETFANPIRRFHRTFATIYAMVFGSLDQSLDAARRLHRRHAAISGIVTSTAGPFVAGSRYNANSVPALRWVYATLTSTAIEAYSLALPALSSQQCEHYYTESWRFAALFGIDPSVLPKDWSAFSAYLDDMKQSDTLTVISPARDMAHRLLSGTNTWLPIPGAYRALTTALLPPRLRRAFELPYGNSERRASERLTACMRRFYSALPPRVRYVGPYQEAVQRIAGRARPDLVARISNRIWIGQSILP